METTAMTPTDVRRLFISLAAAVHGARRQTLAEVWPVCSKSLEQLDSRRRVAARIRDSLPGINDSVPSADELEHVDPADVPETVRPLFVELRWKLRHPHGARGALATMGTAAVLCVAELILAIHASVNPPPAVPRATPNADYADGPRARRRRQTWRARLETA